MTSVEASKQDTAVRTPMLTARGLVKRYGHVTAINGADFDLYPGEVLAIVGDNGAGKSSLIKALTGALQPDAGIIELDGKPVNFHSPLDARRNGIETVYQTLAVAPALDITTNLFLGREIRRDGLLGKLRILDRKAMRAEARNQLDALGIATIQDITQPVESLSGGQRQAVAVARAAMFGSKVVRPRDRARPRADQTDQQPRAARRTDLARHAGRVRGVRPDPRAPAGQTGRSRRSAEGVDERRRVLHHRRRGDPHRSARRVNAISGRWPPYVPSSR
jgi:ABC-type branched-subunit amino acid transport system ATPase component